MRHRKIHILGAAGSGKTSIARHLSERYGIPTFDLDDIFWDNRAGGYGVRADEEERDAALDKILERDAWIIEGSYYRWLLPSFEDADVIIVLTTPVWVRDWRIIRRFIKRRLGLIPPKKKETVRALLTLLKWNHVYDHQNLVWARQMLAMIQREAVECRALDDVITVLEKGQSAR